MANGEEIDTHMEDANPISGRRDETAAKKVGGARMGMRTRTSIVLLAALFTAIVAVSGLTIKLLKGQRTLLEETIRDSQAQTMALLGNGVEQAIFAALRPPFLELKNIPPTDVDTERFLQIKENFPEIDQIMFLSARMRLKSSFPAAQNSRERHINDFLVQRTMQEGIDTKKDDYILHTFLETLDGHPALLAVQRVSDIDKSAGWILIRFNLDVIRQRRVAPLLAEFSAKLGGAVELKDADAPWDDDAFNWPIGRLLPGWLLVFNASDQVTARQMRRESTLMLGVTAAVILAMLMATFAVWRELRREHALVDLRNRFVANVSHELKTPLALIRMYAETLYLRRVTDEGRQHKYHRVLLHEAERLSQMINTVLDFSRLSQGVAPYRLTETDLRATVAGVVDSYRWRVEDADLRLEIKLDEQVPLVAHDRYGITQILLNLIDNAVKYGAAGGVVIVSLRASGDGVELAVTDHGPGIPEEDRERVRKPFERGEGADPASGSGLGLALVEQITKLHHGQLKLTSPVYGTGLEAVVQFPIYRAST
jgi:signal transduction histidine kinase